MPDRVLVRHFLQRFLDHDLISPHADRRDVLAVSGAAFISASLFLFVLLAIKYQFNPFLPPGLTALFSLDDRFLLVAAGMLLVGLVAVAHWDALALDSRDTAVLGVLPIPRTTIVRAKFTAVALFGGGFVVAWALAPTLLRAGALPAKLPVATMGVLRLMIAHAVASCLAGAFAFLAVLGLRESLRALLGQGRFDRVSAAVQALLVVAAISGLLVLPAVYGNVAGRWLSQELVPVWVVPPLWFVGLHEWLAGPVIHGLPRGALSGMVAEAEREATVVYQTVGLQFNGLAALALAALAAVTLITAAACAWNSRRLPLPHYGRVANHPARLALRWLTHVVVRAPLTRAGFFFTAQTLSRSASHRIALATALAVGAAAALLVTGGQVALPPTGVSELPIGALAAQILALGAVISGLRRAMATPVELHANWTFQLCWRGGFESYLRGVRQASWVVVLVPVAFALFVWHSAGLGLPLAAAHAVIGVIVALLLVETAFLGMRRLPFAAGYTPRSAGASVASSIAVLLAAIVLALVEREVLRTATAYFAFVAVLLACWIGLGAVVASRTRSLPPMDFEERPDYATERLNLAE